MRVVRRDASNSDPMANLYYSKYPGLQSKGRCGGMLNCMTVTPFEITPREVKDRLDRGERLRLIDVREPFEHQQARIGDAELIPMRTVPQSLDSLRAEQRPIVVLCHHGMRSLQVVHWLREQGVDNASSMSGGIDQWSRDVDPSVGRYF